MYELSSTRDESNANPSQLLKDGPKKANPSAAIRIGLFLILFSF
jgi:hypothetical protein